MLQLWLLLLSNSFSIKFWFYCKEKNFLIMPSNSYIKGVCDVWKPQSVHGTGIRGKSGFLKATFYWWGRDHQCALGLPGEFVFPVFGPSTDVVFIGYVFNQPQILYHLHMTFAYSPKPSTLSLMHLSQDGQLNHSVKMFWLLASNKPALDPVALSGGSVV